MEKSRRQLNPLYGIGLFLIIMIFFIFVFAPLQYKFGMAGLALTELGILLVTLLFTRLSGQSLKEVFPLARPKFGQLMGTILLWVGCFQAVLICTLILTLFFPEGFLNVSSGITSMFSTTPPIVTFLIVAVMPAICEEAMHRGFILFTFGRVSRDWAVVLCMGLIFGLFHMDPYRFLPTALLGMGLTYVMRKGRNLLLPALFHFINNFMSFLSSLQASGADTEAAASLLANPAYLHMSLGVYLLIGSLSPALLFGGSYLLRRSSGCLPAHRDSRTVLTVVGVLLLCFLMTAAGLVLFIGNMKTVMELENLIPV